VFKTTAAQPVIDKNDVLAFLNIKGTYEFSTSSDIKLDLQTAGENRNRDFRARMLILCGEF
jgi:hypothetical protein